MIAFVEGEVAESGPESVIMVGGLGLRLKLTARAVEKLPPVGRQVRVWTHLAVREDAWTLYGFASAEERTMFRLLITVSGVGPKVAMGLLSAAGPEALAQYLRAGDEKALKALPGIGPKSAARLIVELSRKLPESWTTGFDGDGAREADGGHGDAVAVLEAMGLTRVQADRALTRALGVDPELADDLEAWVRVALAKMK